MLTHHVTIDADSPPGPLSSQRFLRHALTSPDTHGFGKEMFVLATDAGTFVHNPVGGAGSIVMCTGGIVALPFHAYTVDAIEAFEKKEGRLIPEGALVIIGGAGSTITNITSDAIAFLHTQRKIKAIATTASTFNPDQNAAVPPVPVVFCCHPNIGTVLPQAEHRNRVAIVLPLHYEAVSRQMLPASIISLPQAPKSKTLRMLRDCTQRWTPASGTLKGDVYTAQAPLRCPAACHNNNRAGAAAADASVMILTCDVGTHVDSPKHFFQHQRSISDLSCNELYAPAVVIDISERVGVGGDFDTAVTVADLEAWEARNGQIPDGALVAMRSGWSSRFQSDGKKAGEPDGPTTDAHLYLNKDTRGVMHFPGFSEEAAQFLSEKRKIAGLAVDTLSTDVGASASYRVHKIILGASKYNVENLDLTGLPECGFRFATAPLSIRDAFEAPARCIALAEIDDDETAI